MIRTFICIALPDDVKEALGNVLARLRPLSRGVRWVRVEGIHLTLKFLGDVQPEQVKDIIDKCAAACAPYQPFKVTVQGQGAFPNMKRPRVYWIGVNEPTGTLHTLQSSIESNLTEMGFAAETRPFSPHLTLGRVKFGDGLNKVNQALEEMHFGPMSFMANRILVMQSQLKPGGAVYAPLGEVKLGI